jgi:hypothetical protein
MARPVAAQPVGSCPARAEAARPDVPAGFRRERPKARHPVRPSAAAARKVRVPRRGEASVAQPLAAERMGALRPAEQPGALAGAAAAVPRAEVAPPALAVQPKAAPEALAVWDAAGPQPVAASGAAGVRQPEEAAAPDAAVAVLPPEAVRAVAAEERPREAVRAAAAEVRPRGAARVAEGRRRAAPGEAARPSAAAWAALPWTRFRADRPAPSPWGRSAPARESLRIAQR